ncbi:hypothetical protein VTK73DRAFT_10097 [Phialemonium thermophilum]|uniref:CCHC-type domain-containing protein n=1 Tax=Phialemonium thermophilum TaxID=223376 RepID=A0ABR3VYL8_9PEZI
MASSPAPGQQASQKEAICYNCGESGHWVVACPEPTRDVPAGLERWQSQHPDQSQASERTRFSTDKKGPVVTRYPPPPPKRSNPAIGPYGGPPLTSYAPGALPVYGTYQAPPAYPPAFTPPPPPLHLPYQPHPASIHPSPPSAPSTLPPRPSLPPAPPPPPPFHQQPHALYAQQPAPPTYPQPGHYSISPPSAYPPNTYTPAPYASQPPYPPPSYQSPPGPPPPSQVSSHYGGFYLPPTSGPTPPTAHLNHIHVPYNSRHRQKQHHRRGKGFKQHFTSRQPDGHEHRGRPVRQTTPVVRNGKQYPSRSRSRQKGASTEKTRGDDDSTETVPDRQATSWAAGWDDELRREYDAIFAEIKTKAADPVGIPLPLQYTDEPTIPPAYNAKCFKSAFFDDDNPAKFVRSIRDYPDWIFYQHDPAFKTYSGMVLQEFPGCKHSYSTYQKPVRYPATAPVKLPPRFRIFSGALRRSRSQEQTPPRTRRRSFDVPERQPAKDSSVRRHYQDLDEHAEGRPFRGKRDLDSHRSPNERGSKRTRFSGTGMGSTTLPPDPHLLVSRDSPCSPKVGESMPSENKARELHVRPGPRDRSVSPPPDTQQNRPSMTNCRHDSGYHSAQSQDTILSSRTDTGYGYRATNSRKPPKVSSRTPSLRGRDGEWSSGEDGEDRSRSSSPLTALEAELLGLSDPNQSRPKKSAPLRKVKRQVKVAAAFSRRW